MSIGFSGSKWEDLETVGYVGNMDSKLTQIFNPFYEKQLELFNLAAGHIFSEADLEKLKRENRPRFPINLFMPTINSLAGNFQDNIPSLDFLPVTPDDEQLISVVEDVNYYLLNIANKANYEISKAFIYAIIAMIGWIKQTPTFESEPLGINKIEFYDPFRIAFDLENFRRDLKKTKFLRDAGWYTPEEIIQIYGGNDADLEAEIKEKCVSLFGESAISRKSNQVLTWLERAANIVKEYTFGEKGYDSQNIKIDRYGDFIDYKTQRIKAIDFYERKMVRCMDLYDLKTGQMIDITPLVIKKKDSNLVNEGSRNWYDNAALQFVKKNYPNSKIDEYFDEKIYQTSTIPALFIKAFEGEQDIQSKNYNFTPIVAYDHHPDVMELTSVVDQIAAPVKSYNLRENTLLTYVMRQTHASWVITEKLAKTHKNQFIKNDVGGVIVVPEGSEEGKDFTRVQPPASIPGLERFAENNKEDWKILAGTRDSVQGRTESTGESGKLAAIRIQQADLMNEHIAQNAQHAYLMLTKNNIAYMKKYMTEPRMMKIIRNDADPYWLQLNYPILGKIVNDISSIDMDVQISVSPFGKQAEEMQEQKAFNMANFIASNFGAQYVPLEEIISQSTLKGKQKWVSHIQQMKEAEQQAMQQEQELQEEERQIMGEKRNLDLQMKANEVLNQELAKKAIGL